MQDNRYSVDPDQLSDEQLDYVNGGTNGGELAMIQLQSQMSQRQTAIQTTTQMLSSLNSTTKSIINNIK
jgi:hypothetical protein